MTAAIAVLAFAVALALLVVTAAWLDRRGTPGPALCLALPARLVMPHTGHHRDKYATETPAPGMAAQAPRPGDPPCGLRGEVRAGATTSHLWPGGPVTAPAGSRRRDGQQSARATLTPAPGAAPGQAPDPAPVSTPEAAPMGVGAAGADPAPSTPVQGAGQHPFSAPVKVAFPDGNVAILGADHRWRIKPLTWDGRLTGEQPALVPGIYSAFEAWRDAAVNS